MAYVAVRGGAEAIEASLERLRYERLKSGIPLGLDQVSAGLSVLIDQVSPEKSYAIVRCR